MDSALEIARNGQKNRSIAIISYDARQEPRPKSAHRLGELKLCCVQNFPASTAV